MNFTTIHFEGSLISADLLAEIYRGDAPGQKAKDFSLNGKLRLTDEIAASWSDARAYWESFQHGMKRVGESDSGATVTREQWILPLLRSLGFDRINFSRTAAQVGSMSYFISHRLGDGANGLPIHIDGANNDLDKRPLSGRPRLSPHALVQEYLNRTEHVWGIATNGKKFRILRDSERLSRPTYLEFNLEQMLESEQFAEFQLFYRLVHRSRWPQHIDTAHKSLLEDYYTLSIESGGRVREHLRDGVEQALKIFGDGYLQHPDNESLRDKLQSGSLSVNDYYCQLLRLIYRYLFLMVSEERKLVGPEVEDDHHYLIYHNYYSISRFREKVERHFNPEDRYWDLWEGVKHTFQMYCDENVGTKLGVAPLNGDLFGPSSMPDLENTCLYNKDFLRGFAYLGLFKEKNVTRRINYADLNVEELGSVYESLLDYHPLIENKDGRWTFKLVPGTERKSTGSYYTRSELVQELIKSALVPVMEDRQKQARRPQEKEDALLRLKICDLASGSGHFLLAAARRIGKELAKVRTGEDEPTPTQFRQAVRDVIQHCIYGVDLNPLAVDLCKVALWLEGHYKGKPHTFLDHHIKCGNSLIGVMDLSVLKKGIPDDAFKPVTGDDKAVAAAIRKRNKQERESAQIELAFNGKADKETSYFAEVFGELSNIPDEDTERVKQKKDFYYKLRKDDPDWRHLWTAANIWTAAFFCPLKDENDPAIPTHDRLLRYLESPENANKKLIDEANALAEKHRFFHWQLEFPEVMKASGFDVVLGNPPWERIKLQEQEFFAVRDPHIAEAPNKAARTRLINDLKKTNPALAKEFEKAKHDAEANSLFIRTGGRFQLTAVGDINTYALFSELARRLLDTNGRAGIIVPTGIATDDTYKAFFSALNDNKSLVSLFDFENKEGLFQGVHRSYKFSLLTISSKRIEATQFSFFLTRTEHLDEEIRRFTLSADDIALINPNTKTTPVFRTNIDAELTRKIYQQVPVLVNEPTGKNPWKVRLLRVFDMNKNSVINQAKTYQELNNGSFTKNKFGQYEKDDLIYIPVMESKMMYQYNHRHATYENCSFDKIRKGYPKLVSLNDYLDFKFLSMPRYWLPYDAFPENMKFIKNYQWFIGYRNFTNATNERTMIATILPCSATDFPMRIMITKEPTDTTCCLIANLNSLPFDYVARQKIGGTDMSKFILKQLPLLPPSSYSFEDKKYIGTKVIELIYTSWSIKSFAEDMCYDGEPFKWDEDRRALLRAELDAYYAKLYGLTRDELRYILDPQDVYGPDFPGETFRVLKEKEIKKYGEYRTRRLVLEAWNRLFG